MVDNLRIASIEDISAMKLNAIYGNGTRVKDFIDIYYILKRYTIAETLNTFEEKYKAQNLYYVIQSLIYFDEVRLED